VSADQLRRAADLIDEFAAGTTPGPWNGHRSDDGPGYGEIAGGPFEHGYRLGTVTRWDGDTSDAMMEPSSADLRWMCLMSPHVAAPIAAWLRTATEAVDQYPGMVEPDGVYAHIARDDTHPPAYRAAFDTVTAALAFARALEAMPGDMPTAGTPERAR
jgi:hypothetical protein